MSSWARPADLYFRLVCPVGRFAPLPRCAALLPGADRLCCPGPLRMSGPASPGQFLLFLLSMSLSLVVVVSFSMLIYISAFHTLSPVGMRLMAAVTADFLAGGTVPLPFFPPALRTIAELLPFAAMQNMPLRLYSGHIAGAEAAQGIALQLFWASAALIHKAGADEAGAGARDRAGRG